MPVKVCTNCGQEKPLKDFHRDKKCGDNRTYWCKVCASKNSKRHHQRNKEQINKRRKERYRENKDQWRDRHFKINYGITLEEYNQMFAEQMGCCLICGRHQSEFKRRLDVDHDRETKKIRGLLCNPCNRGLGLFQHSPDYLRAAIDHLERI